ncbi:probable alpha-methylacyl-coa racemase [Claviceps purpurea 20.1]|uniref:Probable alpha-methylacyl-coa racemase n=1 Tax=Claviceps purpurea (strain 20.1) TaxID=1111077 RepID=M1W644_CLAP2|nr:probable alpha-methylacyl-coa racemase [Claviceps purpurea 20.1]
MTSSSPIGPPPLTGLKVLEFAGLAPGPFAGMLLADAGASVLRIDRPPTPNRANTHHQTSLPPSDPLTRHKASIPLNLKSPSGIAFLKKLISSGPPDSPPSAGIDILIDPFRPGVLEKLTLGPQDLLPLNPRLIYARLTGFRRDGRYASMAGHDINYLAVSGTLSLLGRSHDTPHPPTNILADFAGGGANLFQGILLALFARETCLPSRGQVVEANMVDGAAYLATYPRLGLKNGMASPGRGRGRNLLDGGCPFYDTYETRDGKYFSVGAIEPQFFRRLVEGLGLEGHPGLGEGERFDPEGWPGMRALFRHVFKGKTRDEWEVIFDGTDACAVPVLEFGELERDPGREGDQRPAVRLCSTPCLAIKQRPTEAASTSDSDPRSNSSSDAVQHGQGAGVPGDGYEGYPLAPGEGGPDMLRSWLGWEMGRDYDVQEGAYVLSTSSRSKL